MIDLSVIAEEVDKSESIQDTFYNSRKGIYEGIRSFDDLFRLCLLHSSSTNMATLSNRRGQNFNVPNISKILAKAKPLQADFSEDDFV